MSEPLVPVHPEATGSPEVLRWVFPVATLDFVGEPSGLPDSLQALYAEGVLVTPAVVEPAAVLLRIGADHSWRTDGARVRRALQAALARPSQWRPPADASEDDVLRAAVEEVLAGDVGDFVRGHGGVIEVLDIADGDVTVALGGACAGCPASGLTVQSRFEAALRRRYPRLGAVIARGATTSPISLLSTRR